MLPTRAIHRLSKHAAIRCQQRAISADALYLLATYGDLDMPAGKGCVRSALSTPAGWELLGDGRPLKLVESASRFTAVIADDGTIVTVYPRSSGVRRPRLRRDINDASVHD